MIKINIAKDFSETPGGRLIDDGNFSGEAFRCDFLEKYFLDPLDDTKIEVNLDGVLGYATSFLEEAFGGLSRIYGKERVLSKLYFVSEEDPLLIEEIKNYITN